MKIKYFLYANSYNRSFKNRQNTKKSKIDFLLGFLILSIQKYNVTKHEIENPHSPILFDLKGNGKENTFTNNNVIIKNIKTYNSQLNSLLKNFKIKKVGNAS